MNTLMTLLDQFDKEQSYSTEDVITLASIEGLI